jgi:hypothetical protein
MAQINIDLVNQQLYAQLELLNTDLSQEELKKEIDKSKAMAELGSVIMSGKKVQLDALKLLKNGSMYKEELKGFLN